MTFSEALSAERKEVLGELEALLAKNRPLDPSSSNCAKIITELVFVRLCPLASPDAGT